MQSSTELLTRTVAEWQLLRLAFDYAQAVDRRNPDLFAALFTADGTFERSGTPPKSRQEIYRIPLLLAGKYVSTLHTVLNQTMDVDGDCATGETYCIAYHVLKGDGGTVISVNKALRYQDTCVKREDRWLFRKREMICDWTEARQVRLGGEALVD